MVSTAPELNRFLYALLNGALLSDGDLLEQLTDFQVFPELDPKSDRNGFGYQSVFSCRWRRLLGQGGRLGQQNHLRPGVRRLYFRHVEFAHRTAKRLAGNRRRRYGAPCNNTLRLSPDFCRTIQGPIWAAKPCQISHKHVLWSIRAMAVWPG